MRKLLAVTTAALVVALGACSSADDDPTADDDGAPTTTASDTTDEPSGDEAGGADDVSSDDGETPSDDTSTDEGDAGDEEVLGSSSARLPADPNDPTLVPLRLDVVALERLSGRVSMRALLTNEGTSGSPDWEPYSAFDDPRLGSGQGGFSLSGASLVDGEAQRAYLALVDSEGVCLCTGRLDTLAVPPGESVELYADFGGVPDDVERIDVVLPGFAAVTQVEIS